MSMFDDNKIFSEHFEEKEVFTLLDAKIGPEMDTQHGEGRPTLLKIKTEDKPNGEWFSVWGQALNSQVEKMDEDDVKALKSGVRVAIVRVSNKAGTQEYKQLVTEDKLNNEDVPF